MLAHAAFTLLFLFCFQIIAFVLNAPLVAYNVNQIMNKTHMCVLAGQRDRFLIRAHRYDATEIFRTLGGHKKVVFIKLGFYLLSFFYYLCVLFSSPVVALTFRPATG